MTERYVIFFDTCISRQDVKYLGLFHFVQLQPSNNDIWNTKYWHRHDS